MSYVCLHVCLFVLFLCLSGYFLQASAYQNGPILYLLHLCLLLLNDIFALFLSTCNFQYFSMEINVYLN